MKVISLEPMPNLPTVARRATLVQTVVDHVQKRIFCSFRTELLDINNDPLPQTTQQLPSLQVPTRNDEHSEEALESLKTLQEYLCEEGWINSSPKFEQFLQELLNINGYAVLES